MYTLLLTILVLDGLFLGVVILLQSGKGGGLAAMGGGAAATEGILGGRQATTVLTRATWTAGTIFMVLALVLSIMSSRAQQPQSILQQEQQTAPITQPEPILPGAGDPAGGGGAGDPTGGGDAGGGAVDPGAPGGAVPDPGGAGGANPGGGGAGGAGDPGS